ncbi:MAG: DUF3467 domain-containing protein [Acidobacteriota bacterium]
MEDPKNAPGQNQNLNVKISDDELKGRYANLVRISHTREEFILDFINFVPPQGMVTARMIMSPGHIKRLITALDRNLKLYEENHGDVREAPEPDGGMSSIN